ncbi:MAG: hypothetical protein ACXWQO_11930 [Bdellovibrionota bacterium]
MKTLLLLILVSFSLPAQAKTFEVFDGQIYNGLYYPMVDIVEWSDSGEPDHMEFHIHQKDKQIELTAIPGERNGKKILWLVYDMRFRGERVCRSVLAPPHFREGIKTYTYKDTSDPDYDNFFVSSFPMKAKNLVEYKMPDYSPCTDEFADNRPDPASRNIASEPVKPGTPGAVPEKKDPKNIGVDYDNSAVPFSF